MPSANRSMTDETRKRLLDAIEACDMIGRRTAGLDLAAFERDDTVRDAVVFRLMVIGEALNWLRRCDPTAAGRVPDLERIVAMRHRLVHNYGEIDDELVWAAVNSRLGPLRDRLVALLGKFPDE